jgi:hypothetical protein
MIPVMPVMNNMPMQTPYNPYNPYPNSNPNAYAAVYHPNGGAGGHAGPGGAMHHQTLLDVKFSGENRVYMYSL